MAIKERLLKQLNNVQDGLRAMPPFHSRDLQAMRNALLQARDLCFQGLPENHFAEYKDTFDGLLLAMEQLAADAPDKDEIVSLCSELLQYMIAQTRNETAFKKEIFFLPYKASMWDSLESVWKAADEDKEHCIAYVMPIPYADLTPEHTVAEWHCERGLFPKYVPTVNWEDFDLKEIHPDVIFIHNPYDEYNRVTSVEGRFYSSVLKNQTDKLVYIPYFVLDEISPGNEAAEEGISGFVLKPAVLNADEVIVQSEDMRQVYINVLVRNTNQKDRTYWEKRILGLGSPKIEKVLTSKKEDFELPEAWAKIVKGKKVILYNTSLNAMLQNSDKVCEKLRYVFSIFKNRDDVALWWRPHPLMKATIHSMRPEIEKEYCEIEKKYIEEGWGVYDDTGDLHRAICWSDAYYGDDSSVTNLYHKTGKCIMKENFFNVPYADGRKQDEVLIWPQDMIVANDELWIMHGKISVLFCYHLFDQRIKQAIFVPNDSIFCIAAYQGLHIYSGRLFLLPYRAKEIAVYDINNCNFEMLAVPESQENQFTGLFQKSFSFGKYLYCVPVYYPYILKIDMETLKLTIALDQLSAVRTISPNAVAFDDACQVGDSRFCGIWPGTNLVLIYDMADDSHEIIQIGKKKSSYKSLDSYKDCLYLLDSQHHELIQFSMELRDVIKVISIPSMISCVRNLGNGKIWLASPESGNQFILDPINDTLEQVPSSIERNGSLNYFFKHSLVKNMEGRVFIYDRCKCELSVFEKAGMILNYKVNAIDVEEQLEDIILKQNGEHMRNECSIEEIGSKYVDILGKMVVNQTQKRKRILGGIGERIYGCAL